MRAKPKVARSVSPLRGLGCFMIGIPGADAPRLSAAATARLMRKSPRHCWASQQWRPVLNQLKLKSEASALYFPAGLASSTSTLWIVPVKALLPSA
jgi:hypothetical protein